MSHSFPSGPRLVVRTEEGQPVELNRRLGAGGQGEVWEAIGGRVAVKILHSRHATSAQQLTDRLHLVRCLDLEGLPLASPLVLLAPPQVGYTMVMLSDMVALRHFASPAKHQDLAVWYAGSGGLRRRLRLLGRAAAAMSALHARGMCYGDPSPYNVMVSEPLDHEQVVLIDVDNIAVVSEVHGEAYTTPGYGAPEVITGRLGVSSLSDAFSFAVIAFETLAIQHPFIGDLVYDGEPGLEERALRGELPWVDHPDDRSNQSSFGLARGHVLTPGLRELANRAFEVGIVDLTARPTVGEWRSKLLEAADLTLLCEHCRASYYANEAHCPWCRDPAPPALVAEAFTHVVADGSVTVAAARTRQAVVVQRDVPAPISIRTATGATDVDPIVATLSYIRGGDLSVGNGWDRPLWVVGPGGGPWLPVEPGRSSAIPGVHAGVAWELHFGSQRETHRLVRFRRLALPAAR